MAIDTPEKFREHISYAVSTETASTVCVRPDELACILVKVLSPWSWHPPTTCEAPPEPTPPPATVGYTLTVTRGEYDNIIKALRMLREAQYDLIVRTALSQLISRITYAP